MRSAVRAMVALGVVVGAAWPLAVGAQGSPSVRITAPRDGATVRGPQVEVRVQVQNFRTVDGGTEVRPGEGHAHILVNQQAPRPGEPVPQGEGYVHLGSAPYDRRTIDLPPGRHTLTAVLGDSAHRVLDPVAAHTVTVTVQDTSPAAPTRPANTGDGSLASEGPPLAVVMVLLLGLGAVAARVVRARI
ncbi:MAG TPA: DUF4399 domain-containing protein [Actinomycetota bacterium]|nr:DUF4399 domain-containing protein [Actinomycetota bacterium]